MLRGRISQLSAAILRINTSLDPDTVLHEAVKSARLLTAARYSVVTTIDEAGLLQDFVTSGITADERRSLEDWRAGLRLFEHLRDAPAPLRVPNLADYVDSLGYSPYPLLSTSFLATPMRHRDMHVGSFFLAGKEGGEEFTDEDQEILVLFAAQAASAIVNARTYHSEHQTRADLEALVDTSPVGVVVFQARTGTLVSLNLEAKRIVEGLRTSGSSIEELLEVITYRRADGEERALSEFALTRELSSAETVRAEEIVLSVPDGRSVTTLVNATPIHSSDGTLQSVVVTMQDLAPLQEVDRVRAEFLSMVSHELRAAAGLDQGLDRYRARGDARRGSRRDDPFLPHHRRAGRSHARPHR